MPDYTIVPASEMQRITESGATILDVRTALEHAEQHIDAVHEFVPLDQLDAADFMLRRGLDSDAPVYMLCRSGMRARKAADMFEAAGYKNIYVIEGGIIACANNGEPVSGTAPPEPAAAPAARATQSSNAPVERQVRLVAGGAVVLGTLLGHFIHPVFYLLAFGTGAALMYTGWKIKNVPVDNYGTMSAGPPKPRKSANTDGSCA